MCNDPEIDVVLVPVHGTGLRCYYLFCTALWRTIAIAILLTSPRFQYSVLCGSQLPLSNVPRLNLNTPSGDPYGQDNTLFSLMALQLRFSSDPSVEKRGAKLKVSSDNGRCTKEQKSYNFLDNRWRVFFDRRLIIWSVSFLQGLVICQAIQVTISHGARRVAWKMMLPTSITMYSVHRTVVRAGQKTWMSIR